MFSTARPMLPQSSLMANDDGSYRLEFASGVWRDVGLLPREAYARLTERLQDIAREAGRSPEQSLQQGRVEAGELGALFEIDHAGRMVLVLRLIRTERAP